MNAETSYAISLSQHADLVMHAICMPAHRQSVCILTFSLHLSLGRTCTFFVQMQLQSSRAEPLLPGHSSTAPTAALLTCLCLQDVVTDFDSHHIGLQQPQAPAHQENDTHLHDQPAPDVTSTKHTSAFAATSSPVHSPTPQQPAAAPSHGRAAASEPTTASIHEQQWQSRALEAPSSPTRHTCDQAGAAVAPGQPDSRPEDSVLPASAEQAPQEPSPSMHDASGAFHQQPASASDSVYPLPPTMARQPEAATQPAIHARSDAPSYTPSDIEHTGQTSTSQSEGVSVQPEQQEPETRPAVATSADASATGGGHVDDTLGRQSGQAEQPEAGIEQPEAGIEQPQAGIEQPQAGVEQPQAGIEQPQASAEQKPLASAAAAEEELPAGSATAVPTETQQADVTAATASSQQADVTAATASSQQPDVTATPASSQQPDVTAATAASQQADVTAATASSQQNNAAQQRDLSAAPKASPDADQSSQVAAASSSILTGQQGEAAGRGAAFPAGPLGEMTYCCSTLHLAWPSTQAHKQTMLVPFAVAVLCRCSSINSCSKTAHLVAN